MDLKTLIEPKARHIFIQSQSLSYAFPIVHVDDNWLYFSAEGDLPKPLDGGHFLGLKGSGIVTFDHPEIESLKDKTKGKLGLSLYRIDFNKTQFNKTNRRRTQRFEFKDFIPMTFNVFGEAMVAQLTNISEGGLRMTLNTPIKSHILCQLELKLPLKDGSSSVLKTNGIVVYCGKDEESSQIIAGINFVAPEFVSADQKQSYLDAQSTLKTFVEEQID